MIKTLLEIDDTALITAGFVFLRTSALTFVMPFFGERTVPIPIRVLLSLALAIVCYPFAKMNQVPEGTYQLSYLVVCEIGLALLLGFGVKALIECITSAASLVGYQMGFGTAGLLLQDSDMQLDGFSALHRMVILIVFLGLNLHHLFLIAIIESFTLIPIGEISASPGLGTTFINWTAGFFGIILKLATPILIALLLTMAALGLVARAVPQMNVFQLSFPVSFYIGLLVYIATMTMMPSYLNNLMSIFSSILDETLRGMMPVP